MLNDETRFEIKGIGYFIKRRIHREIDEYVILYQHKRNI